MRIISRIILFLFLCLSFIIYGETKSGVTKQVQIAFLADVHLQDIYGEFQDNSYKGTLNPGTNKFVLARTMKAQLKSTRLFNENYFAFLSALDTIVARNIKYVVLPGDFSDDGQPINVRGLKRILDNYSQSFGIRFLATTGNHDPVRPFTQDAGKVDFLGCDGKPQVIMSAANMYKAKSDKEHPIIITKDIRKMGYEEIMMIMGDFGFFPKKEDVYWETPFSSYAYDGYKFHEAIKQSSIDQRTYSIPPNGSPIPDVSYLVEPEDGIWFLAIDANVYIPKKTSHFIPENPNHYQSASVGYNNVLSHKKHLIPWVKKVTDEAQKRGKTLIVFSHYPMIDFNDDASENIEKLLGEGKMQSHRLPQESVARMFADAGIKLHFGGHMHINDTGLRHTEKGNSIVNVQIPSLAAYIPAFKILTIKNPNSMEVETIILDSVSGFKELFPLYEQEHAYLSSINDKGLWNKEILNADTYHEFTNLHLKQLVRSRFLEDDWPLDFKHFLEKATGADLLRFANASIIDSAFDVSSYVNWTGFDMIFDMYRLRSADKLALADIGLNRIKQYEFIIDAFLHSGKATLMQDDMIYDDFREFAIILHKFMNGAPANHFAIDFKNGGITSIED